MLCYLLVIKTLIINQYRNIAFKTILKQENPLKNINLKITKGETVGIVGESGCGKSTLGRLILGLEEPTSGTIAFEGKDITAAPPAERRRLRRDIQVIFQDPFSSLNPRMTVGSIVEEPLKVYGLRLFDGEASTCSQNSGMRQNSSFTLA